MNTKTLCFRLRLPFVVFPSIVLLLFIPGHSFSMDSLRILQEDVDSVVWMGNHLIGLNTSEKRVLVVDAKSKRSLKTFTLDLAQPKALAAIYGWPSLPAFLLLTPGSILIPARLS